MAGCRSEKPRSYGPAFAVFCTSSALVAALAVQMTSTFAVFAREAGGLTEREIGYLFSLNGIIIVLVQLPLTSFASRFRMSHALTVGAILYALGYFLAGFSASLPAFALCITIATVGECTVSPAATSLVAALSASKVRGRYMGFLGLSSSVGSSVGPLAGGLLLVHLESSAMVWSVLSLFGFAAALCAMFLTARLPLAVDSGGGGSPSGPERATGAGGFLPLDLSKPGKRFSDP